MDEKHERIKEKLAEIETEMRRVGLWQDEPLPKEAYGYTLAFARDTMAFHQWLQFVFIPQVIEMVENYAELPKKSEVAITASQAFAGWEKGDRLVELLRQFDELLAQ
jgi:uncharacterized protein YqcC (DUF446 family)